MDQELGKLDQPSPSRVGAGNNNSGNLETDVAIRVDELVHTAATRNGSALDKPVAVAEAETTGREGEDECPYTSIDVVGDDFSGESKPLCRICHLSAKELGKSVDELMVLGCECRGELGVAHLQCAEAWFRVKGNQLCEICGVTVKNMTGAVDNAFVTEWTEGSGDAGGASTSIGGSRRCMHRQPACNFLVAFLVIAFVLPWFLHIDIV